MNIHDIGKQVEDLWKKFKGLRQEAANFNLPAQSEGREFETLFVQEMLCKRWDFSMKTQQWINQTGQRVLLRELFAVVTYGDSNTETHYKAAPPLYSGYWLDPNNYSPAGPGFDFLWNMKWSRGDKLYSPEMVSSVVLGKSLVNDVGLRFHHCPIVVEIGEAVEFTVIPQAFSYVRAATQTLAVDAYVNFVGRGARVFDPKAVNRVY